MKRILSLFIFYFSLSTLVAQKVDVQQVYGRMLRNADSLYHLGNCVAARDSFSMASTLVKKEVYAKGRAEEITKCLSLPDSLSNCVCRSKRYWLITEDKKIKDYIILINRADSAVAKNNLKLAQQYMNEATRLDVSRYIAEKTKGIEIDNQYKEKIARADNQFLREDYDAAKATYTEASKLKPNEQYPRSQLKKCNEEIAKLDKFALLKMQGEELYMKKEYKAALDKYQQAAKLYPEDGPVKKKVEELTKLVANTK